jgi:hypothetical protein
VNDRWTTVPADVGDVRVRIVRPPNALGTLPVILYMHGGGWVLGNADTHDRLVRDLAIGHRRRDGHRLLPQTVFRRCSATGPSTPEPGRRRVRIGGDCAEALYRTRTDDPFLTMEVLYQLS